MYFYGPFLDSMNRMDKTSVGIHPHMQMHKTSANFVCYGIQVIVDHEWVCMKNFLLN